MIKFSEFINEGTTLQDVVKSAQKLSSVNTAEIEKVSGGEYVAIKPKNSSDLTDIRKHIEKRFKRKVEVEYDGQWVLVHLNSNITEGTWHSDDEISDLIVEDEKKIFKIFNMIREVADFRKKNKNLIKTSTKKYAFENSISELKEAENILHKSKLKFLVKE